MPLRGHFNRLSPIIAGLVRLGRHVDVFTHRAFEAEVCRYGASFHDLFSELTVEEADATSIPTASRYVSFAGIYSPRLLAVLSRARPRLIVYDSFAVIGFVVARLLDVPSVCVCAGHNRIGPRAVAERMRTGPVHISTVCDMAVNRLHQLGLTEITPFSYLDSASPYLNVYCEPPSFLKPCEREPFEPIAFYGSVEPTLASRRSADGHPSWRKARNGRLRVYVSFGTAVWQIRPRAAEQALRVVADALTELTSCDTLVSLGVSQQGALLDDHHRSGSVHVEPYVDQWNVLGDTDLFVTHQGLNSTHEAIFHCVPMIAHPFFGDQPALAKRCAEMGLSIPLSDLSFGTVPISEVRAVLEAAIDQSRTPAWSQRRAAARASEIEAMKNRPYVLEQISSIAQ
ncbi:MAG TPA: glycosyltransferase [Thermoanaerobaculia bacterium]|nr:glycosyltransferase [Thermoanaerobaculia bacterium]